MDGKTETAVKAAEEERLVCSVCSNIETVGCSNNREAQARNCRMQMQIRRCSVRIREIEIVFRTVLYGYLYTITIHVWYLIHEYIIIKRNAW